MKIGSGQLEEPEDAFGGASQRAHRRHTGRVSLRRKPMVEANGGLKDQAPAKAGDGSLASQTMQSAAQAKECIDSNPGGSRFRRELEPESSGELRSPGNGASRKLAAGAPEGFEPEAQAEGENRRDNRRNKSRCKSRGESTDSREIGF